ncbi:Hypothetical protein CINCED_3A014635 [Cinara cedri]|uniref:Uncharacterized protein n=1 Tax=Cinara cedri TaxID=506608 RepID=A0A5E4NCH4_9HEMI|nr:Hypothetical protein CINCED_3A014635 [Cinara cedri]
MRTLIISLFLCCAPTPPNASARDGGPEYRDIERTVGALKRIVEADVWKNDLSTRDVLFKGKITRLEDRPIKFPAEQTGSDSESDDGLADRNAEDFVNRKTLMKVSETSKLMYTALGCKFSDLIVETLRHFAKINTECQNIELTRSAEKCVNGAVAVLIAHKRYFVKMMYNLFVFADAFPNLKFADQTLVKSLMSVNSYLHYLGKNERYRGDVKLNPHKKVLAQMINLVERSRCRKCPVIHDRLYFPRRKGEIPISKQAVNDDFESTIRGILSPVTRQLESYYEDIDVTSLITPDAASSSDRRPYDDGMYDTENVLLGFVFDARYDDYTAYSAVGTVELKQSVRYVNIGHRNSSRTNVVAAMSIKSANNIINPSVPNSASDRRNKAKTLLIDVYQKAARDYDLEAMYDYQTLLVTVVGELFSAQFYHFFNESAGKCYGSPEGDGFLALLQLVTVYGVFVNVLLPDNFPPDRANAARRLYGLVTRDLEHFSVLSADTLAGHRENVRIIDNWHSQEFVEKLKHISLNRLISNVVHHENFDGFRRLFRLFLGEPNTLRGYRMHNENDGDEEGKTTGPVCLSAYKLRQSMFLLQILMFGHAKKLVPHRQLNGTDFAVLTAVDGVNEKLANAYDRYAYDYDEIKAILVPVSMRLRNVKIDDGDGYNNCLLTQYCLLTANLLEHFEINNCTLIHFSDEMYAELTDDRGLFVYDGQQRAVDFNVAFVNEFFAVDTREPSVLDALLPDRRIAHNTSPSTTTWWVHRYFPDGIFVVYNGSFNSNKINWDGTVVTMNSALKTVTDSDVIEYGHLVRYQLVRLEWSVHSVFKKMLYVANHVRDYPLEPTGAGSDETVGLLTIKNDISTIQNLSFPVPIRTFLLPIFSEFTRMIDAIFDGPNDGENVERLICNCISTIEEQSRYLCAIVARDDSAGGNDTSEDIRNDGLPKPTIISLGRIHCELLDDREYLTAVLKPSAGFNANIISHNDFFYIY